MKRRHVFIDDGVWLKLIEIAKRDGVKIAEVIRRAIVEFLRKEGV